MKWPGCMQRSIAMPDIHSGYGFAIGNVAAFDMADPTAVVSPGGVGFDINCGVRLIRTNLVRGALCRRSARAHRWHACSCRCLPCALGVSSSGAVPGNLSCGQQGIATKQCIAVHGVRLCRHVSKSPCCRTAWQKLPCQYACGLQTACLLLFLLGDA